MITVLAGGVGAAKFLDGLAGVVPPQEITVIANTGDDSVFHGLHVSPDVDTVLYTLSGLVDRERGWGIAGDTFHCLEALRSMGEETWFQLGDRDLATHLLRTRRLREGVPLSQVTQDLAAALAAGRTMPRIIPMSDDPAPTRLRTATGVLSFQEYFVKLRAEPEVLEVDLSEAARSRPAPGVIESIAEAAAVVVAPCNPFLSIGPILAIPGVREALRETAAPVAAVSPIVGGRALKGPAASNLKALGYEVSAASVADLYRDFLDLFVLDCEDASLQGEIEKQGVRVAVTQTVMSSLGIRQQLARTVVEALKSHAG